MGNTNSGRGGLPREKRLEVYRMIRAGQKNAHIARTCGIDVSTVSRYKRRLKRIEGRGARSEAGEEKADVGAETERCGGCGGSVLISVGYCIKCYLDKTVFEPKRQKRIARHRDRRSQKARVAA